MKLLFDQNLSPRLPNQLEDIFPGSLHVREVGLIKATDTLIWEYARQHEMILISKDADFHQRSLLFGPPPQVIWIRLGNCSVSEIELLLCKQKQKIQQFAGDKKRSLWSYNQPSLQENTLFDVIFQAQDFRLHGMAFRTFFNHPIACFQD